MSVCGNVDCNKQISTKRNVVQCGSCLSHFHIKCSLPTREYRVLIENNIGYTCHTCMNVLYPFNNVETSEELYDLFNEKILFNNPTHKQCKCGFCKKRLRKNIPAAHCTICSNYYHFKCENLRKKRLSLTPTWCCSLCTLKQLPFFEIGDDNMLLTIQGLNEETTTYFANKAPSFSIKSLLDQIPGQTFETDQFLSDTVSSKYYSISEFISAKFSKHKFSIYHLNIASLQKHIHELRTLLSSSLHNFDSICISETRLQNENPLVNINIDGYDFIHTPTHSQCGGAGMYIKRGIEYEVISNLSKSCENTCESIFIEVKHTTKQNVLIGSIYRHHTPVQSFIDTYFKKTLQTITKSKKRCILAGDFNVDLIKYGDNKIIDDFYDGLSSHSFRPLILQPTRVTSKTLSLIDNIFTNDVTCFSNGGNITSSISDHFSQFTQLNIFEKQHENNTVKYGRNWRIFNKNEFKDELISSNWDDVSSPHINTNTSVTNFYKKNEKLLDEMAPVKKLSKKEIGLKQRPWITPVILTSMYERDMLYKDFSADDNPFSRDEKHKVFKTKRI